MLRIVDARLHRVGCLVNSSSSVSSSAYIEGTSVRAGLYLYTYLFVRVLFLFFIVHVHLFGFKTIKLIEIIKKEEKDQK